MDEVTFIDPAWWEDHPRELITALQEGTIPETAYRADKPDALCLSVEQAAELLGVSRSALYDAIARHEVPSVRIGRRVLVPRKALEEWLERSD
jgi:excisionase family DNA binding protein